MDTIKKYFQEARAEFAQVTWPTRAEAIRLTVLVIGLSLLVAVFLGLWDMGFAEILKKFILRL